MPTPSPHAVSSTARRRWPLAGAGQRPLLLASLAVIVGSLLPWVDTAFGSLSGTTGAGVWTLYIGFLGLAGAVVPSRRAAVAQATVLGVTAIGLPVWQIVHLLSLDLGGGWVPGIGLLVVLGAGPLALYAAWRLHLER